MGMTIDESLLLLYEMGYNKGFKDGIKGSILKADYENRLKADMVAMLTEMQLEMESLRFGQPPRKYVVDECLDIIQQKINSLKGDTDGK